MTIIDLGGDLRTGPESEGAGCTEACERCESPPTPGESALVPRGFATAIAMAEAAASHNRTWWNEIRTHADDPSAGEYCSSLLLGTLLEASAHRLGVPAADVWANIRHTGELPL
ncbi:hypothetical protein ACLQ3C_02965 [Gordonia sp. DT30]|uniref:hypothetical protein n=1 Tax=unclassified Gordonia (in: high G+C Gram-positive bacteria) TaxID=2657482 RepID=UPI003CEDC27D